MKGSGKPYTKIRVIVLLAAVCVLLTVPAGTSFSFHGTDSRREELSAETVPQEETAEGGEAAAQPDAENAADEKQSPLHSIVLKTEDNARERIKVLHLSRTAAEYSDVIAVRSCLQELDADALVPDPGSRKSGARDASKNGGSPVFWLRTLGDYTLTEDDENRISDMLEAVYSSGYSMGFVLLDIRSGKGLCYNSRYAYYSASSAKASFVVSLAMNRPEIIRDCADDMEGITVYSDNEIYAVMQEIYGLDYYEDFAASVGVHPDLSDGGYAFFTAEDLARLWLGNYLYFSSGKEGRIVGSWFENPEESSVNDVLGKKYRTRTKAGWIDLYGDYCVTVDAGIVYAGGDPYIIVLMSDFPSSLQSLNEAVKALDKVHEGMTEKQKG